MGKKLKPLPAPSAPPIQYLPICCGTSMKPDTKLFSFFPTYIHKGIYAARNYSEYNLHLH